MTNQADCRDCKFFESAVWECDYDTFPPEAIPIIPYDGCKHSQGISYFIKDLGACPFKEVVELKF